MVIDNFYKEFKIKDYLEDEIVKNNNMIDLTLGVNPFLDNDYIDPNYTELKNKLINIINEDYHTNLTINNLSFSSGTMGILRTICTIFLNNNDTCLGISPQFPRFISEVDLRKASYTSYKLPSNNNYKFNVEDFIKEINNNIKLIYIDNPNNPTGQVISITDLEKILVKAKENNIEVLIDEAYGDYMPLSNSAINLVNKYDNLIVAKSASKGYGLPNDRIGYVISSKEIIEVFNKVQLPFPFSKHSQEEFSKTLDNRRKISKSFDSIHLLKKYIIDNISKENYLYTTDTTPILTIHSNKYSNLKQVLLENDLLVESCQVFDNLDKTFARIRVGKEKEKIVEILNKVL